MSLARRKFLAGVATGTMLPWLESWTAAAPGPAVAPTASSSPSAVPRPLDEEVAGGTIGNLLGPIQRIRDAYGWASESFAADKYQAADHPAWRQRMLQQVFASMFYTPAKSEFHPETVERVDRGKFIREKVYFNTTPELRVPAYVLVPKNLKGKAPAIIGLHDHGGFFRWGKEKLVSTDDEHPALSQFKQQCYAGRSIADDLAEAGYVVIVIDMFYWGERRMRLPDDVPPGPQESLVDVKRFNASRGDMEQSMARRILNAGFTWAGLMLWDDIRTVDYLVGRPEVDPGRIGCVGLSVGSFRSIHLAALDDRIQAAVGVCWLTSFRDLAADNMSISKGFSRSLPGIYRHLDVPDIVSLAAPRALLCINGLKDKLFPIEDGVRPAYRTLAGVYAKLGAADKFRGHFYDTLHEFNLEMQQESLDWFRRWL